ncbi:hypothetical protein QQ045_003748 [Rhodiola kirilowii]
MENRISFVELANNMALAKFKTESDMKKVRDGGPWLCMDSLILMHEWCSDLAPEEFIMNRLGVWAQMHNLLVGAVLNDKECGEKLAGNIGKFIKVGQSESEGARKRFIRVRVEIEIDKPLVTGFFLRRQNRDPLWVNVNYERLPGSCSKCGRLNHDSEKCIYVIDPMQAQVKKVVGDSMEKQRTGSLRGLMNREHTEHGERKEPKSGQNPGKAPATQVTNKEPERSITSEGAGDGLEMVVYDKDVALTATSKAGCRKAAGVGLEVFIQDKVKEKATYGSWMDVDELDRLAEETNFSHSPKRVQKTCNSDVTEQTVRSSSKTKEVWHDVNIVWCGLRKDTDVSGSNMMLGPSVISPISNPIWAKPNGDRGGRLDGGWEAGVAVGYGRSKGWGLAILWNNDIEVTVISYSAAHIDVRVRSDSKFFLTLFYGSPRCNERKASWDLLRRLRADSGEPWVVMGDFNEILFSWEMESKRNRQAWQMRNFRQCLEDCGLMDLGFSGNRFTYTNKRREEEEVKARQDRVVANNGWRARFPKAAVRHVFVNSSDHVIVLLYVEGWDMAGRRNLKRFEPMCLRHMEFKEKVRTSWVVQTEGLQLKEKLKACMSQLARCNGSVFGRMKDKIRNFKEEIQQIREGVRSEETIRKEANLSDELDEWLGREELYWRNTSYFHAKASQRKRRNHIKKLKDTSGELCHLESDIIAIMTNYFSDIFHSQVNIGSDRWHRKFDAIPKLITNEMNEMLNAPFTGMEVKSALFHMHSTKVSGLDEFPALFFQRNWVIVGEDVIEEVLNCLNNKVLDAELNETLIVLIPKVKEVEKVEDLRPISLCKVVMKIITKVLANRLKEILPTIISQCQSAFIRGRLIMDNILIAHEVSHFIKRAHKRKIGYMSMKLDMSKDYDRIEWHFLEKMLASMGFAEEWIKRIMLCVITVS